MHCITEFLQHGMFRYRLLRTFVYFFNFLSMMFSGKPLISAGGPENSRQKINPYLMLWILNESLARTAKGPCESHWCPMTGR
jgi:hypothetical protein